MKEVDKDEVASILRAGVDTSPAAKELFDQIEGGNVEKVVTFGSEVHEMLRTLERRVESVRPRGDAVIGFEEVVRRLQTLDSNVRIKSFGIDCASVWFRVFVREDTGELLGVMRVLTDTSNQG